MTIKEIIDGLQMTIDLFLFDSETGEDLSKEQLNDLNRTTVEACEGAIELLKEGVEKAIEERFVLLDKEEILQAGLKGREADFHIGGRLFAIREKAQ